jgi:hypothetical protein
MFYSLCKSNSETFLALRFNLLSVFPRKGHYVFFEENEILVNPVKVGVWQEHALKHRSTSTG